MIENGGKFVRETLDELCDPRVAALLVIDMQNDAVHPRGKLAAGGRDISALREIAPLCGSLINSARRSGVRVIHVCVRDQPGGPTDSPAWIRARGHISGVTENFFVDGTWGADFCAECTPLPDEPIVAKHRSSAFTGTDLDMLLRASGVETLVVIGEQTPGCVEATLRDATHHDYYTVLVEDCVAAFDPELHAAAMKVIRSRHDIATSMEVESVWESSAGQSEVDVVIKTAARS